MARYLMSVFGPAEPTEFYGYPSREAMEESMAETGRFNDRLQEEGYFVFADGLAPATTATVASDGMVLLPHGFVAGSMPDWSDVIEIVVPPRSGRRGLPANSTPGRRRATPWPPRSPMRSNGPERRWRIRALVC